MLPQSKIDLSNGIVFQDQPSLTWIADPVTNRLRGRGDNWEAVRQAVEVIVNVERFKWQIYTPNFGTDYDGLLGTEPGYAASELRRRLEDAFLPDSRILSIKDYTYTFDGVSLSVTFTVTTVFGDVTSGMEADPAMIDLSKKTYRNILEAQLARVPNSLDKREGSMIQTALGAGAYSLEEFYLELDQIQRGAYFQTAVGEDLDYLAVLANVQRYPASPAVRLGVFNMDVPIGSRFSTIDGADSVNFVATEKIADGRFQMTCETPGTIGNQYTGPVLPITFIQGLTTAEITDILIAGDDEESDDELRERAISALNEQPFGGNVADYKRVVLAIDGVGGLQVYPTWDGGGTVKLSIIGADWMPASQQLVETVQNTVDPPPDQGLGYGTAPIGAKVTVTTPETVEINVSASLAAGPGYTAAQLAQPVRQAVDDYLLSIRQEWDEPESSGLTHYSSWVYAARVTAAILSVQGVVNVTGLTINGEAGDLQLTEDGLLQQVPVLGR